MVENQMYFKHISQTNAPNVRQSANIGRLMNETLRIPIVKRGLPSLSCSTESLRNASAAKRKNPRNTTARTKKKVQLRYARLVSSDGSTPRGISIHA